MGVKPTYYAKIRDSKFVHPFDSNEERNAWVAKMIARKKDAIRVRKHRNSYLEIKNGQS